MRRRQAVFVASTALALSVGVANPASASAIPDPHSLTGQCTSAAVGQHLGWSKQSDGGRNVGGTCGPVG